MPTLGPNHLTKRSLTLLGLAMSAAAIWRGWVVDSQGFVVNILAALALVGPGLVLSNVLVARFEGARAREEAEKRTKLSCCT